MTREKAAHHVAMLCRVLGVSPSGYYVWRTRPPSARAQADHVLLALWIADITYVRTWSGWLYLAVVLETFSRRVVGWSMADTLESALVVDALNMALWNRRPKPGRIHHSDRGGQYTSLAFGRRCREAGILPSMGRVGNAYDNAMAEAFFATLETELLTRRAFPHRGAARAAIFDYIEGFYNSHRRHSALGYLSPAAYERRWQERVRTA